MHDVMGIMFINKWSSRSNDCRDVKLNFVIHHIKCEAAERGFFFGYQIFDERKHIQINKYQVKTG